MHIEGLEEYEERLKEELRVATAVGDSDVDSDTSDMGSDRNSSILSGSSGGGEAGNENRRQVGGLDTGKIASIQSELDAIQKEKERRKKVGQPP